MDKGYWVIAIELPNGDIENHKVQANDSSRAIADLRQRLDTDFRVVAKHYSTGNTVTGYRSPFQLGN